VGPDNKRPTRSTRPRCGSGEGWREPTTVGTVAACGFGGVLYKLLTNDSVLKLLTDVVSKALRFGL